MQRLRRMNRVSDEDKFLESRILSHTGHHIRGSNAFLQVAKLHFDGTTIDIPTYQPSTLFLWHNDARAAIEMGGILNTRVADLGGKTIDHLIGAGERYAHLNGDFDTIARYALLRVMAKTNEELYDDALEMLSKIKGTPDFQAGQYKHLSMRLLRIEAVIFGRLCRQSQYFRHIVFDRLTNAAILARELGLPKTLDNIVRRRDRRIPSPDWD